MIDLLAISIANGAGVLLMLVIVLCSKHSMMNSMPDNRVFFAMVAFTMVQCLTETATFFIDGQAFPGCHELQMLLNTSLYICDILFAFLWTVYADLKLFGDTGRIKRIYPFVFIPALLVIVGTIANWFVPIFFSVDAQNVYQREAFYPLPFLLTYLYLIYGVALIYGYRNKVKKYLFMPAILFMVPIFIGSVLQFVFYGCSLVWLGTAIAMTSLYVNIQNEASYIDSLSGLFNRHYMTSYLFSEAKRPAKNHLLAGIMLDIDQFKAINDTYGHLVGDEAIAASGLLLRTSIDRRGIPCRYAGDEFVVICQVRSEADVQAIIARLDSDVERFNETKGKPYKLHFSTGYSIYLRGEDSIDDFLKRMDDAMYRDKHIRG